MTMKLSVSVYGVRWSGHAASCDVIKWNNFPRYWPFVRGIHRSPVNSPHKGQWRGALMFTLICARINGWVNNREAGDLRRYRTHYDVIVMYHVLRTLLFWSLNKLIWIRSYKMTKNQIIAGTGLDMCPTNEKCGYIVTTSFIGWVHA